MSRASSFWSLREDSVSLPFSAAGGTCPPWLATLPHIGPTSASAAPSFTSASHSFRCPLIRTLVIVFRVHLDNTVQPPHVKILTESQLPSLFCYIRSHFHWLQRLGHGYLWGHYPATTLAIAMSSGPACFPPAARRNRIEEGPQVGACGLGARKSGLALASTL